MKRSPFIIIWTIILSCLLYAQPKEKYDSPRLAAVVKSIEAGEASAVTSFLDEIKDKAPLVEPVKGDNEFLWITFIWRGDKETKDVAMIGGLNKGDLVKPLARLQNTELWYRTEKLPKDSRFTYSFLINFDKSIEGEPGWKEKATRRDPLNPKTFIFPPNSSVVELPAAPPQPWLQRLPGVPEGKTIPEKINSLILKEERNISIYTPPGYDSNGKPCGLLILFNGEAFPAAIPVATILNNLISKEKIPPVIAVMVNSQRTGVRDLSCSPDFADFLATELVPWVRKNYSISTDPKQTVMSGASLGGLAAAYAGLRHSEVFGNVLSQSGSFWYFKEWSPKWNSQFYDSGWLIRQFAEAPHLPLRFYLEVGRLEQGMPINMTLENRRMRDVLTAKGYPVTYSEFNGGHDYLCWRGSLADGLIALIGKEQKK